VGKRGEEGGARRRGGGQGENKQVTLSILPTMVPQQAGSVEPLPTDPPCACHPRATVGPPAAAAAAAGPAGRGGERRRGQRVARASPHEHLGIHDAGGSMVVACLEQVLHRGADGRRPRRGGRHAGVLVRVLCHALQGRPRHVALAPVGRVRTSVGFGYEVAAPPCWTARTATYVRGGPLLLRFTAQTWMTEPREGESS